MRRLARTGALVAILTQGALAHAQEAVPAQGEATPTEPPPAEVPGVETPTAPPVEQAPPPPALPPEETPRARARESYARARAAYAEGRFEEALKLVDEAFESQDAPTLLLARAYTLDQLGRRDDARRAYVTYLRRRPDDPEKSRIELRMSELDGTGSAVGAAGARSTGSPAPSPKPKGPKPPYVHDGPLLLRLSGFAGALFGSLTPDPDDEDTQREYSDLFYGVGASVGAAAMPGLSIALEGQFLRSNLGYKDVEKGDEEGSGSDGGLGLAASLEFHVFPDPSSGLHLVAGGGYLGLGHDAFDKIAGARGHVGAGWTFWLTPQMALDPMLRVDLLPAGDHNASMGFYSANIGLLWH